MEEKRELEGWIWRGGVRLESTVCREDGIVYLLGSGEKIRYNELMVKPASQCRLNGSFSNREISDSIKFSTVKILGCWDSRLFEFTTVCRLLELTTV